MSPALQPKPTGQLPFTGNPHHRPHRLIQRAPPARRRRVHDRRYPTEADTLQSAGPTLRPTKDRLWNRLTGRVYRPGGRPAPRLHSEAGRRLPVRQRPARSPLLTPSEPDVPSCPQTRTQDFAQEGATCSRRGPRLPGGPLGD